VWGGKRRKEKRHLGESRSRKKRYLEYYVAALKDGRDSVEEGKDRYWRKRPRSVQCHLDKAHRPQTQAAGSRWSIPPISRRKTGRLRGEITKGKNWASQNFNRITTATKKTSPDEPFDTS